MADDSTTMSHLIVDDKPDFGQPAPLGYPRRRRIRLVA
jgi:hypothetical protein